MKLVKRICSHDIARDVQGLSTVEYVIILCLIAVFAIVAWKNFGGAVEGKVNEATEAVDGLT